VSCQPPAPARSRDPRGTLRPATSRSWRRSPRLAGSRATAGAGPARTPLRRSGPSSVHDRPVAGPPVRDRDRRAALVREARRSREHPPGTRGPRASRAAAGRGPTVSVPVARPAPARKPWPEATEGRIRRCASAADRAKAFAFGLGFAPDASYRPRSVARRETGASSLRADPSGPRSGWLVRREKRDTLRARPVFRALLSSRVRCLLLGGLDRTGGPMLSWVFNLSRVFPSVASGWCFHRPSSHRLGRDRVSRRSRTP
jgi:hypothetical protein